LLLNISHNIFFIYKSCAWKTIPANHHQNVIQLNKIQKNIIQINVHVGKKIKFNCVCNWNYLKNQLKKIPFRKISIKYEILKLMFMQYLKSSMG